ncbi:hypothetical protein [Telluribacter sp.]|jgi:hypothetical protein|uniref:hypothetical protein n=1 Tax=Telluribacter sp. TaxID=1978767 RepID=UPI002E1355FB|nr:hypothetical protein [Telluribacter sp.]
MKIFYLWFLFKTMLCGCQPDRQQHSFDKVRPKYKITKTGTLPAVVRESSGLARVRGKSTFWTHNDSGGAAELYEIDQRGALVSTFQVPDVSNVDWEDLAQSPEGILYIADTGNNDNTRRSLRIYAVSTESTAIQTITFRYADHTHSDAQYFDSEALFYHNQKLYLFSKNRIKTEQYHKLYELPAQPGDYVVSATDSILIQGQVTGADISPDGRTFALLTYGKILLFGIRAGKIDFSQPQECIRFVKKQTEAILFLNNTDLLVTNEQRQLFRLTRR